jgi:hypothetical protein
MNAWALLIAVGCTLPHTSPQSLTNQQLADLKEGESITWGLIDDSFLFSITPAQESMLDTTVKTFANQWKLPVWTCVHDVSFMMGKIDPDAANKKVTLTFVNKETGQRISTFQTAGTSGMSPFYVVLPAGLYTLDLHFTWPGVDYRVMSEQGITVAGNRDSVYLGHLHMAMNVINSTNMLFDTGNFATASEWFRAKHPSFQGRILDNRVTKQIIVTGKDGRLLYVYRWRLK